MSSQGIQDTPKAPGLFALGRGIENNACAHARKMSKFNSPESRAKAPGGRWTLIEQGVHIGKFHNLEELARDKVYEFCYICCTAKIKGTVAGFTLRPIAVR